MMERMEVSKKLMCTDKPKGCRCVQDKWVFDNKINVFREDFAIRRYPVVNEDKFRILLIFTIILKLVPKIVNKTYTFLSFELD